MRKAREVAIYVYRGDTFLVARRVPQGVWNVIAGQVEDGETFRAAAERELAEETGLVGPLIDLELPQQYTIEPRDRDLYPPEVTTVVIHSFVVEAPARWEPTLNHEHDIYRWCALGDALGLLHWPEARDGLRALASRLSRPPRARSHPGGGRA